MTRTSSTCFAIALLLFASCQKEADSPAPVTADPDPSVAEPITIVAGFETQTPAGGEIDSKTYVYGTEIRWSSADLDKVLYVFDSKGKKNVLTSTATSPAASRSFSGSISSGSEVRLILWSGKYANEDKSEMTETSSEDEIIGAGTESIGEGGTIDYNTKSTGTFSHTYLTGTSLSVANPQNINNTNSFAPDANIAVMRPGDSQLKSVFGYLRYRIPVGADGAATIKSIRITADEDIVGRIKIDCSGIAPVATIISNGSKSLTVNTRWQTKDGGYYEPGTLFAVLPAGTYHNMKITITPFSNGARTQDAATGTPFTISCRGEVVVQRGFYTDLGTLPLAKPTPTDPGFLFDTDFFTPFTDPVSGVVSYRVRSDALGWDNSQSLYYIMDEMTNDERFLIFMVSGNEFRPSYNNPPRSAKILDLQTRKLYTFYATDGCYPYLDPVEDKLYYFLRNDARDGGKFYRRDLLVDPGVDIPLANFPSELLQPGVTSPIKRALSHLTLTRDKQKVFIDAWLKEADREIFRWGMLDLYTGEWDPWGYSTTENVTHGQINPVHDDEVLCAIDSWTDSQGVAHSMANDPDGTCRRMQYVKKDFMQTIKPNPEENGATHEGWSDDGDHVYWCSHGINVRNIRTNAYRWVLKTNLDVEQATHCNPTANMDYWVFDDAFPDFYRGGRWKVHFLNPATGKRVYIYSQLPAIATREQQSRLHPDPHPHFVCNDKYIICTAAGDDGNLHFSITPVDQLISLTQ
jgi:hypothetical protein